MRPQFLPFLPPQLLPYFPVLKEVGGAMEKHVATLMDAKNDRVDIRTMATSYSGKLRASMGSWVSEVRSGKDMDLGTTTYNYLFAAY